VAAVSFLPNLSPKWQCFSLAKCERTIFFCLANSRKSEQNAKGIVSFWGEARNYRHFLLYLQVKKWNHEKEGSELARLNTYKKQYDK